MNLIHPDSTKVTVAGVAKTGTVGPKGLVKHREHWDGRVDAKALPGTITHRVKPKWSEWLKLMELEDATAELRRAQLSKDTTAIRKATHRYRTARAAFTKVRFNERVVEATHVNQS